MIDAIVLCWFVVGVLGTICRSVFFRQPVSFIVRCVILLYCGAPFLFPLSMKAIGILALFIPFFIHYFLNRSSFLNLASLFLLWLPFEMGFLSVPFDSSLPVDYAIILLSFFSVFITFSRSRSISLFHSSFKLSFFDLRVALFVYLMLLLMIVPTGIWIGFLTFNFFEPTILFFVQTIVVGYFLYALAEELLFRFLMFDFFKPFFSNERTVWVITSIIFGFAHINNRTVNMTGLNWAYVLLSTVAGFGYGFVYLKTRKVSAAALTHALINMTWGMFFNSPY